MAKEFEKLSPQNIEAEEALLGSLLIDNEAIFKVADKIEPDDFYKDVHKTIYQAILDLWEKREPLDILNVANRLAEKNKLEEIGDRSYLVSLANKVPTSSHVVSYAQIIQKKSSLRKLIKAALEITSLAYQEAEETEKILDKSEQKLFAISQKFIKKNFIPIKDVLGEAYERINELSKGEKGLVGVPTGFIDLDNILGCLQPSDLILLAARPSIGKSSLALDIARNAAVYYKMPVGIFSLEMSTNQAIERLIAAQSGVNLWQLKTGKLSHKEDGDFKKINQALSLLAEAQIFIDDSPIISVNEIRTKARRLQLEHHISLLIIDYLQLMESSSSYKNRLEEVTEISRYLKALARELDIPVIALSQLSRAPEARTPAIPKLSDLRDSGTLEQDSDIVLFIYRKFMDRGIKNCSAEEKNITEIHIAKHRHGPVGGIVKLYFDEGTTSFKNLEKDKYLENELEGTNPF